MFRPINRATNQETSGAVFGAIFEHCANGLVKSLHTIELRIVSPVRVSVLVVMPAITVQLSRRQCIQGT